MSDDVFSGNRGEWSEPYVLLKLLADGNLYLGDRHLNKIENIILPIISILREEQYGTREYGYSTDKQNIIFDLGNPRNIQKIPIVEFNKNATLLLEKIRNRANNESQTFSIPEIEQFLHEIGCTRLSARSSSKSDIFIKIHDIRMGLPSTLGFSIKSELGKKATLLNASQATNFIYEIQNCNHKLAEEVNNINPQREKIRKRMEKLILEEGCTLIFQNVDNKIFSNNLVLIDTKLKEILAEMIYQYYLGKANTIPDLSDKLYEANPNGYDYSDNHQFYEYKIKRLLCEAALGMRPTEVWEGRYDATGGYLIVKEDGDIICYHLYSYNQFEDYLFFNTKFDTGSSKKHKFGMIYEEDSKFFIKLNLQIRFT